MKPNLGNCHVVTMRLVRKFNTQGCIGRIVVRYSDWVFLWLTDETAGLSAIRKRLERVRKRRVSSLFNEPTYYA